MDDGAAVVVAMVEGGEGQDEVVDLGGGYADRESGVVVTVLLFPCCGLLGASRLGPEHAG